MSTGMLKTGLPNVEPSSQSFSLSVLPKLLLVAAVLITGFFAIDHSPGASTHFRFDAEFIDSENRTADRVETVNIVTAPVRLLLGMAGVVFLMLPARGNLRLGGIVTFALLVYLSYLGASTLWSINPKVTLHKFIVMLCFFVAAAGLARQLTMFELTMAFAMTCLGYIGIGFLAELALGNFTPHKSEYRFVGTCHPNTLAVYGTFCCLAATVHFGSSLKLNPWMIAIFIIGVITLLATKSRTTLAGFVVALMAARFVTLKPNLRVFASSLAILALIAAGMYLVLSRSNVRASMAERMAMGRTKDVSSLTGRLPLWEELLVSINERPLIGHGYLAYWEKDQIDYLSALLRWEIPHGHNMYLDVLLDGGAIGLVLFLSSLLVALFVAFRRCVVNQDRQTGVVFGLLVFALIHGTAESLFKMPTFLTFMLMTLVLRMAFTNVEDVHETTTELPKSADFGVAQ